MTASAETTAFVFDGPLPLSETFTGPVAGSVAASYDGNLRFTGETVNGANSVGYAYDLDGLLSAAGSLSISRDAGSGRLTGTALGTVSTTAGYDASYGDLASLGAAAGGSGRYSAVLTRDTLGRVTQVAETVAGATHTLGYTYDTAGRLSDVTRDGLATGHYAYDPSGNRSAYTPAGGEAITTSYDAQDRLGSYRSTTYAYTPNGEPASQTTASQSTAYGYDNFGRLTSATLPNGTRIDYVLDAAGRRVGRKLAWSPVGR